MIKEAFDYLTDWRNYIIRVRDLAYNQPSSITDGKQVRARVRSGQPEVSTGLVVSGIIIKVAQLLSPVNVVTPDPAWKSYLENFTETWLNTLEKALIDKFLLGLSFVGLEVVGKSSDPVLSYFDPYDIAWLPDYRIDESPVYLRRLKTTARRLKEQYPDRKFRGLGDGLVQLYIEYAADAIRVRFDDEKLVDESPNPCSPYLPIFPVLYIYPPGVDVPIGDWELGYPQQRLLDEVRRSLLSYSRRGGGWIILSSAGLSPAEIEKIRNGKAQEPVIVVEAQVPQVAQVSTPPPPSELLQLENMIQQDLNTRLGVSDYERLTLPTEKVSFATEAQLIAQSSARRARKDLFELRMLMENVLSAYARYSLFLKKGGKTFVSATGETMTLPTEPPALISVRDISDTIQEQVKAQFLTQTFLEQLKAIQVNPAELLKVLGSYIGLSEQEIMRLEPKSNLEAITQLSTGAEQVLPGSGGIINGGEIAGRIAGGAGAGGGISGAE